jgi:hypothetical protein
LLMGDLSHAKDAEIPAKRGSATRDSERRNPSWKTIIGAEDPESGLS